MDTNLLLLVVGIVIGAMGVLFGATGFLFIPFLQYTLPGASYAQILGNGKVGSVFRGIASSISTWKHISFKEVINILIPFTIGSVIGSLITLKLSQSALLPAIILAIIISEISPRLAHLVNKHTRFIFCICTGIYSGFIGPGISILIIALLRTYFPKPEQLVFVKLQSPFVEMIGTLISVVVYLWFGSILWPAVFYWSVGMFIGGYLGGHVLKKSIHLPPKTQKIYIYIIYLIAVIAVALSTK